jgi:hypothetical protein
MWQKAFGGHAPLGPAGELTALPRPLARFLEKEDRKGRGNRDVRRGKEGQRKRKGKMSEGKGAERKGREEKRNGDIKDFWNHTLLQKLNMSLTNFHDNLK